MGQKTLNFVFNVSRRAVLVFEGKIDALRQREESQRKPVQHSSLLGSSKDHVGMNLLLALVLYCSSISSYNQVEPFYQAIEEPQPE